MPAIRRQIRARPLLAFGLLAYGISWLFWLPALLYQGAANPAISLLIIAGGFGPPVGAGIVIGMAEGRPGLRRWFGRIVQFRAPWHSYLFAVAWPIAAGAVVWIVNSALGGDLPPDWSAPPLLAYPLAWTFVLLAGGGQEEPGWRGLALPLLLKRHSPLVASVILGLLWGLWHLPLFVSPSAPQSQIPLAIYLPHVIIVSVIFTWLYLTTQGSVWLAMVLHAGLNAVTSWVPIAGGSYTLLLALLAVEMLTAVGLVLLYGARRFVARPPAAVTEQPITQPVS